ncbi:MAG TPA: hypothetical protein VFA74_08385 [Terriglobales bacterium]|nr:hypothetical protein [Terriglobales bacterium]
MRAGIFGNEAGSIEAWVYPLKILRNFHLLFHVNGRVLEAETLARTISVRPESYTVLYADDTFQVKETVFTPVHESGAVVVIEVVTSQPLEIEAEFQRDFQLEWPTAFGGAYLNWNPELRAFEFGEEQKKFAALVGSQSAAPGRQEYFTNYSSSAKSSFLLGQVVNGKQTKVVVIAGSVDGPKEAAETYRRLSANYQSLLKDSANYYAQYLDRTVSLTLPDKDLQRAYDWSRISVIQGLVSSPYLGSGLIAGYRTSGDYERPGFAWFFGRDALWTSFALNAEGDFETVRAALDFLSRYQRDDGKIPHEIAQTATLIDWFKKYPYGFASADATPLYIVAFNDYVVHSGDAAFAIEKWNSLWKAYQFLKSTYNAQGLPQNFGFGHGWVEGGPLLPVNTELYQSALGAEALRSLANLARISGKNDLRKELDQEFVKHKTLVNQAFWSPQKNIYSFALDNRGQQVEIPSVLATVPMWFGLLDENNTETMINELSGADHEADWGMRIISSSNPLYNPGGYHFGSVWPLFTGWASVGEYHYHRSLPAYLNLKANALLALNGSLGHVTEVLSGDYYQQLSTSSPHQIWSAAMVVSPLLQGMLGLENDAAAHTLKFAPHVPAEWKMFEVKNVRLGDASLNLKYQRDIDNISLTIDRAGKGNCNCSVEFSPALSPRAEVTDAELDGRRVQMRMDRNTQDQHALLKIPLGDKPVTLRVHVRNDFGIGILATLPPLGAKSQGLRVLSESWSADRDNLTLQVSGIPSQQYELDVWNAAQITRIEGAELVKGEYGVSKIRIKLPGDDPSSYVQGRVILHF